MLGNLVIGLREGIEASLVIGILVAALVRSGRREYLSSVWLGVLAALFLSVGAGAALTFGAAELDDTAEEVMTGVLSVMAVVLVTWMVFWMVKVSKTLSGRLRSRVDAAGDNRWSLALVAFLAVAREGLETALFLWAAARSAVGNSGSTAGPLLGAVTGLSLAAVAGYLIYLGALRVNIRTFMTWSAGYLIIVAAGVLSYGVGEFQEAGLLPGADVYAYDLSAQFGSESLIAALLKGVLLVPLEASVLAAVAWVAYLVPVGLTYLSKMGVGRRNSVAATNS